MSCAILNIIFTLTLSDSGWVWWCRLRVESSVLLILPRWRTPEKNFPFSGIIVGEEFLIMHKNYESDSHKVERSIKWRFRSFKIQFLFWDYCPKKIYYFRLIFNHRFLSIFHRILFCWIGSSKCQVNFILAGKVYIII